MKYNNGDIDDLFRRASENYPLRTDSADWDRLSGALDGDTLPPSDNEEERRRRRGLFWWFLLIPLAAVGYLTWQMGTRHTGAQGVAAAPAAAHGGSWGTSAAAGTDIRKDGAEVPGSVKIQKDGANAPVSKTAGGDGANAVASERVGGDAANAPVSKTAGGDGANAVASKTAGGDAANADGSVTTQRNGARAIGGREVSAGKNTEPATLAADPALALLDLRPAPIGGRYQVDAGVVAPKTAAKAGSGKENPKSRKPSSIYFGLSAAPDMSTVKFQSMKGVGTTFGLLLGYAFNDRWAAETGLYVDRKRYYTEAEYFNTSKVSLPSSYDKLLDVNGTCYMLEVPVNVRYNFNTGHRLQWFATTGLSTYFMSRENYIYQYEPQWGGTTQSNQWDINKPYHYWFSIINLSAGFEQNLGKIGNLRLEPYIRIPMSGIGTGNLPIMSAGVNIGLTHRLW